MSRELPILCAGPVVRAILDGRQTQDRRPVKPQPEPGHTLHTTWNDSWRPRPRVRASWEYWAGPVFDSRPEGHLCGLRGAVAPWSPGDVLYVRETWRSVGWRPENGHWIEYAADGRKEWREAPDDTLSIDVYDYNHPDRWRPSIHMPKWAARIRLRVLSVGVERVNAISEEDARAEACATVAEFAALWDSLYGAGSFDSGAWCWVTRFERVTT